MTQLRGIAPARLRFPGLTLEFEGASRMPTTTGDYYEVLGLDRSASREDVQRTYRKLARRYHPDVSREPDAEETFKRINVAHEVLADPKKRERYDRYGDAWRQIPEDYDGPAPTGDRPAYADGQINI